MYVLASGSPRRRELLSLILPEYDCVVSGCEEFVPEGTPAERVPVLLAEQKALAVAALRPGDTVIGSDTVVVLDGKIFGKPKDADDARGMLRRLSGRKHFVYTGVAVAEGGFVRSFFGMYRTAFCRKRRYIIEADACKTRRKIHAVLC